jgi:geranylgeranyl diphosphate synthase type I
VDARLLGFLDAEIDAAEPRGRDVVELVASIRDLCMRGGKRLRPALLVAGYRAADGEAKLEPALDAGVALELLQAYFLIHDDWMDRDTVRRGGPAVHTMLARRYRSRHKGDAAAILAGDYAAALAMEALSRVDARPSAVPRLFSCFAEMQTSAVAGQQLDLIGRTSDVELVYTLKTASYTVRGPLRMGALLSSARPQVLTALDRFAMPVGVAFQLRDDLLSAFGDPSETGKPYGNDLRSGKRTLLLLLALQRASSRERRFLERVTGKRQATEAELRRAIDVLESSGARALVERRIGELVESALAALHAGRLEPDGTALLEGAARALTSRRS